MTMNRIFAKRYDKPLAIQQAVQGSKLKCNALAMVDIKFGDWTRKSPACVARLAGYDAIVDMPTTSDGRAIIYAKERKIYFTQWDFEVHCTIPETPPKSPKFDHQWNPRSKAKTNLAKPKPTKSMLN